MSSCDDWPDYRIGKLHGWSSDGLSACYQRRSDQCRMSPHQFQFVQTNLAPPLNLLGHYAFSSLGTPDTHFEEPILRRKKKLMYITTAAWTRQVSLSLWRNREEKLSVGPTWRGKRPTLPPERRSYCQYKLSQKKNGKEDKAVATNHHVSASCLHFRMQKRQASFFIAASFYRFPM